jgi:hypothetical protein
MICSHSAVIIIFDLLLLAFLTACHHLPCQNASFIGKYRNAALLHWPQFTLLLCACAIDFCFDSI